MPTRYRRDFSDTLIHFIRSGSDENAFQILCSIVRDRALLGSSRLIKGGHSVVCFTESPFDLVSSTLLEGNDTYRPFGLAVSKQWLFAQGGRPVIYQSGDEYDGLPEAMRWRHVRYEPHVTPAIDFSWEREWRIRIDALPLPAEVQLIVPDPEWCNHLWEKHEIDEDRKIEEIAQVVAEDIARGHRQSFPWRITIADMGRGDVDKTLFDRVGRS